MALSLPLLSQLRRVRGVTPNIFEASLTVIKVFVGMIVSQIKVYKH